MPTVAIPPLAVPAGARIFGPVAVAGGWTHLEFALDIAALTALDILAELSTDGGASWQHLVSATRVQPSAALWRLTANWPGGLPAGQVRVTLQNDAAFASAGGSLLVS